MNGVEPGSEGYRRKQLYNRLRYFKGKLELDRLRDNPCVDCGGVFPYYIMEFDHVETKRSTSFTISKLIGAPKKMAEELEKCDLLCANCHRVRTHFRAVYSGERLNPQLEVLKIEEELEKLDYIRNAKLCL
jgi:hypothetical protein